MLKDYDRQTNLIHAGERMDPATGAKNTPIYQSSTFVYNTYQEALDARKPLKPGEKKYGYSRVSNPTVSALEEKMAILEGGEAALCTAWGMSATSTIIMALTQEKKHVICSDTVYGGTHLLLNDLLSNHGITTSFVDMTNIGEIKNAISNNEETALVFLESPTNPTMKVVDIETVVSIAHKAGAKEICDNTFMTAHLIKPLSMGADFIASSLTKYISGHGNAMGGVIVGERTEIEKIKLWRTGFGTTLDPFDAWLFLSGMKTLSLRMDAQCANALKIAKRLEAHPKILKVYYPGLESHPQHELAKSQAKHFGGVLSFEIEIKENSLHSFFDELELCALGVSLGDVSTLIEHPATMTHGKMTDQAKEAVGITPGMIRLSVGLESPDDVMKDLERGLDCI